MSSSVGSFRGAVRQCDLASRSLSPNITWPIVYRGVLMDTNGHNDFLRCSHRVFRHFSSFSTAVLVDKEIPPPSLLKCM